MTPAYPAGRRQPAGTGQNDRVSEPIDEFSFLPEQAADVGIDAPIPRGERLALTLDGRADAERAALRRRDRAGRHVPARRGAERPHLGHDDPRAGPAGARDRPARVTATRRGAPTPPTPVACSRPMSRPASRRGPTVRSCWSVSRSAVSPRPRSRHPAPISSASSSSSTSPPASIRTPARRRSASSSPARPTGRPATSSSTARWRSDSAARAGRPSAASSSTRGSGPTDASSGSTTSRTSPPRWPPPPNSAAAAAGAAGCASRGVLSRAGWDDLAAVTAPITLIRGDRGYVTDADAARVPANACPRHPSSSSRRATTCRRSIPVDLGRAPARARGEGLTLVLRSV